MCVEHCSTLYYGVYRYHANCVDFSVVYVEPVVGNRGRRNYGSFYRKPRTIKDSLFKKKTKKPGVSQNTALRASQTVRNSAFLVSIEQVCLTSFSQILWKHKMACAIKVNQTIACDMINDALSTFFFFNNLITVFRPALIFTFDPAFNVMKCFDTELS